jgi:hypothetical protein
MKQDFKKLLMGYKNRMQALQGMTAHPGNLSEMDALFAQALQTGEAAEEAAQSADARMRELLEQARAKVPDAIQELNELRMEKLDLYVRATSNFASMMYETVTLKDNEQACIESSFTNVVSARYVAQDGGARTVKAVKARKHVYIDMREITSDEVGYQLRDINQGTDIAAAAKGTVDIGFDLTNKVDIEAYGLLVGGSFNGKSYGNGIFGSFRTTGSRLDRTWVANARINASNLPTTNDITNAMLASGGFNASGPTSGFRLAVIRYIMWYCAAFGNIFGSPLQPTGAIFVPSSEVNLTLPTEITPTGIVNNKIAEGILGNFTSFDYMGIRWTLIPDVTLPLGTCYPVLNRPVGKMFVKPQMDQEWVETNVRKNWETRGATKVASFYTLEPWRPFALRIAYVASPAAQQDIE